MMKYMLVSLVALVLSLNAKAQDTVYLDADYKRVEQGASYEFYIVTTSEPQKGKNILIHDTYLKSGLQIYHVEFFVSYFPPSNEKVGEERRWYNSGQIKSLANYVDGELHGSVTGYWENGQVKRKDNYKKGKLKKGEMWDENGEKIEHVPFFKRAGCDKWSSYMMNNLTYPTNARKKKIEGMVIAEFVVDEKGGIFDINIKRSIDPELDAEVVRLIKGSPPWHPMIVDGVATRSNFTLPVSFRLDLDED